LHCRVRKITCRDKEGFANGNGIARRKLKLPQAAQVAEKLAVAGLDEAGSIVTFGLFVLLDYGYK